MEMFHVLNRGVDKRNIVSNDADRMRFMQGLYMYNDAAIIDRNQRRHPKERRAEVRRKPLVSIHAYCLMNNHYHLLLSPVDDDMTNLSAFMRKLNMGYAKYFNEKYQRTGALWQGKYKKIHIERDAHFMYIPYYIHLNPLDFEFPEWRDGSVKNTNGALDYLLKYKWSSYLDYTGIKNYPSIIHKKLLLETLTNSKQQLKTIQSIITSPEKAIQAEMLEK